MANARRGMTAERLHGRKQRGFVLSFFEKNGRYAMVHQRIEMNPAIMGGKPVIRGTRVPVETILRKLGAGFAPDAILADHPRLTADDIQAAQAFAK